MENLFWKNKRVFITGHTGFKGSWLSLWLTMLGAKVVGYALSPNNPSLFDLLKLEGEMKSIIGDINDQDYLKKSIMAAKPDIVIHLAAQALVLDSYEKPTETYMTNVMGTLNLLECVRQSNTVKTVLVITTDKCYENRERIWGYREEDALGGYDPYSSSKACAEILCASYRRSFLEKRGIVLATARAGNVIGGGDWAKNRLVPDCLRAIANGEKIVVRNPNALRPWQHVLEALRGYLMLIEKMYTEGEKWAGAWNFGPNDTSIVKVGVLVEKLCRIYNSTYEIKQNHSAPHEAGMLRLDSSKANFYLGWKSMLGIDETLLFISEWDKHYNAGSDMCSVSKRQIDKYNLKCLSKS